MATKIIGKSMPRAEDPRLITGAGQYVDDVQLVGMAYAEVFRSSRAHALIKSINIENAKAHPGVVTVITAEDVEGKIENQPVAAQLPDMKCPDHPPLAINKVYFVGQPIAVVVAEDRYTARDALDLIDVDYEELPVVTSSIEAMENDAPVIHEDLGTNVAFNWSLGGVTDGSEVDADADIDKYFDEADLVVSLWDEPWFVNQRLIPVPMEARGVVADWSPGERLLTVWTSTQIPHLCRSLLAGMLGLSDNHVRVIAPDVGGGFGQKLNIYVEEPLVGFLAMQLERPVKWTEGRRENFTSAIHGRDQRAKLEAAVKNDGTVTALRYKVVADLGSYCQVLTAAIPTLTGLMLTGSYKIPAAITELTAVYTNKMSTDAYRGAGRPEATYLIERIMDRVAQDLGKDPIEVRRKNFLGKGETWITPQGTVYDSIDYEAPLEKALELFDYEGFRKEQEEARKEGRYLGVGFSTYVEICGMGPSAALPAGVGGFESATVRIEPSAKVTVFTGASPHGQGQETSFAQIAADELGVTFEDVVVVHGDTDKVQYGIGTFGSRGTAVGGTAVYKALQTLKDKVAKIAAFMLEIGEDDLIWGDSGLSSKSDPSKVVTLAEVSARAHDPADGMPEGVDPGLATTAFFHPENFTYPFGTHICLVDVCAETGEATLLRYIAVDDVGRVINPMLVEGQIIGGIVQALGQAMMEEGIYDEGGQLATGELMDYAIPRAKDVPEIVVDRTETPSPVNPLGVKGCGEAGTIGATPAIVNAVVDALSPFGIKHLEMPLRPERIWRAINNANGS